MAAVTIGSKTVGSIVKLKENGVLTDYIVVHQGLPSAMYDASCNGTWLLRKDIAENRSWNNSSVNDYANSTIQSYLNSTFIARFEANIQNAIKQIKLPYRPGSGSSQAVNSGVNGLSCKIFLPSACEIGFTNSNIQYLCADGTKLEYFIEGLDATANNKRTSYLNGVDTRWWLRSPCLYNWVSAWVVFSSGGWGGSADTSRDLYGVRPALIVPASIWVMDDSVVAANLPPTAPSSLTVPTTIKGGTSITVSWGAASDADGNLAGYRLERSVNGGGWAQVYQGAGLSCSNSITYGWQTATYRVKAYDALGVESGYTTSPTRSIINNSAPTAPASITVPATVRGGKPCAVSWGAATDVDGNLAGYQLERSVNDGTYAQIYQGTALAFTDSITRGWTSVAYRVRAYDAEWAMSGYRETPARTIINNLAPQISGADGSLGALTKAFSQTYSVSDDDGDPITVSEKLDGVVLRTFAATAGTQYTATMDAPAWQKVLNGNHTLAVTASDNQGGVSVRTWTFAKSVTAMSITLAAPLPADAMPTRCIVNVTGIIAAGALYTVEVCNNGNDAAPTWENCTQEVLDGRKHFFSNQRKTAANWGFNIRVCVDRSGAVGDCFISGLGGNFD